MPSPSPKRARPLDVIVYGATGFTGALVAESLALRYPGGDIRWGLGGRSQAKLEAARAELAQRAPHAASAPLVVADAQDGEALRALCRQTRVVASTAGPFALHGSKLVAACVAEGTDYVDITGEVQWVRRMIDAHHDEAAKGGTHIVPCCGFDSIPSDLGVCMLHDAATARGLRLAQVKFFLGRMKGGGSGGTVASMLNVLEEAKADRSVRKVLGNPYGLNPAGAPPGPDGQDLRGVAWDEDLGQWVAPFLMAAVNTRVVRRTNALLGYPYGTDFRYQEVTAWGSGPGGFLRAARLTAGMGAVLLATQTRPTLALLKKALPAPGAGPSREERERGYFDVHLLARTREGGGGEGPRLRGRVHGDLDPGYGQTAVMLSEAALCLARGEGHPRGGVETPASAMGMALVERLRRAGMVFQVDD